MYVPQKLPKYIIYRIRDHAVQHMCGTNKQILNILSTFLKEPNHLGQSTFPGVIFREESVQIKMKCVNKEHESAINKSHRT